MSISLKAYPLAFLIYPENTNKKISLIEKTGMENTSPRIDAQNELKFIKVRINLSYPELKMLLKKIPGKQIGFNHYMYKDDLYIRWASEDYCYAIVTGGKDFQTAGEEFFKEINEIAEKNIRLIDSAEYFYYNYKTRYTSEEEIKENLKNNGHTYYYDQNRELCANINGQKIKYYIPKEEENFYLEVEQKISIVDIGLDQNPNVKVISSKIKEIRVKTNIKRDEIKQLLKKAGYIYYEGNGYTPLGSGATSLNWVFEDDGYCYAVFNGGNQNAIMSDMGKLFPKVNVAAGRDIRRISSNNTQVTYTYSTNYTDKGVLYNVLVEHGAQDIEENGENISCTLYGMIMYYIKDPDTNGYNLEITQVADLSECEDTIKDLNDEYGMNMQEITYNKIKERLEKENLRLESEEILDDNSIVLTIEV